MTMLTRVLDHKNSKRIWLEGKLLEEAGFLRDKRFNAYHHENNRTLELEIRADGTNKVSGRERNNKIIPIIDLCDKDFQNFFKDPSSLKVEFSKNYILIS